jgi:hypothetical protein
MAVGLFGLAGSTIFLEGERELGNWWGVFQPTADPRHLEMQRKYKDLGDFQLLATPLES